MKADDFLQHVTKKQFFTRHQKVLIAVSGGVDSMNLLHFLYVSRETLGIDIGIAHVNHHQRLSSQKEEDYLKAWAKQQSIPFHLGHFEGQFSEKRARDYRYAFFRELMQVHGYTALVTAHHADDQVETIFMRLLRGSKLRYQSGIKERQAFAQGELIRPFLAFTKSELPSIFHFEDDSNHDNHYLRNRVRNRYLPDLRKENPNIDGALLNHGRDVAMLIEALQELTKTIDSQDCKVFQSQSPSVQRFLLEDYLANFLDLQIGKSQFEQLLRQLNNAKNYDFPLKNNYHFNKTAERFMIEKISPKTDSQPKEMVLKYGLLATFGGYAFSYKSEADTEETYETFIPLSGLAPLTLRHRKPGDRIFVKKLSKKLRRFFIDEKVPHKEREETIIVEQNNEILAVLCQGKTYLSNPSYHDIMRGKLYIQKI